MTVSDNKVVSIHYTLTNDSGEVMDQSQEGEPLVYLHGAAGIIPGLEKELSGKAVGENFKATITPDDAYGERNQGMVQQVPRSAFPADIDIEVGMQFNAESPDGPMSVSIAEVKDDTITVDGNHPLAGLTLHFEGSVEGVRDATAEELEHGHVH